MEWRDRCSRAEEPSGRFRQAEARDSDFREMDGFEGRRDHLGLPGRTAGDLGGGGSGKGFSPISCGCYRDFGRGEADAGRREGIACGRVPNAVMRSTIARQREASAWMRLAIARRRETSAHQRKGSAGMRLAIAWRREASSRRCEASAYRGETSARRRPPHAFLRGHGAECRLPGADTRDYNGRQVIIES